jgi:hypothetical protein
MKYFLPILFIACLLVMAPHKTFAAAVVFGNVPTTVAQQQQFYIDIKIDPQGVALNGIQAQVLFSSDTLSFVRAETGTSLINYFIDAPSVSGNTVTFSGTIVGGFNGLIDPFDQTHTSPGQMVRLVFAGIAPGNATITTKGVTVTDNDGSGTLENVPDATAAFAVSTAIEPSVYTTADTIPPAISASVVKDTNLYDGKYALIFTAVDKESGIDHVQLQEGNGPWTTIESPYVLRDQTRKSILSLRAYDVAGNVTSIQIIPPGLPPTTQAIILAICILLGSIIVYVIYEKTKHRKIV